MKILLITVSVVIFIMFLSPLFMRVHNLGMLAGSLLGVGYALAGFYWDSMSFTEHKYVAFLLFFVTVILAWLCEAVMANGKSNAQNQKVIIVLGCRVRGDIPSLALEKRVESAYFYLVKNPESVAILSGGQGRDENISEGECMKNMLVDRGIDEKRLLVENRSVSTDQNIRFSKNIISQNSFPCDVAVATSRYHQYRAKLICKRYGLNAYAISSSTQAILLPCFLLRELMAIVNELIRNTK